MATRDKDEHAFTPMLAHGKSVQDQNMVALDDDNEAEDEDVATAMTRGDSFDSMIATNTTPTTDYGGNGLVSMPATISASSPTYLPREQEVAQLLTGLRDGLIVPPASSSVVASRETGTTPRATFISRVSNLPMVNATMQTITNVYESGKNTSTVLKYSAETVEHSVKSLIDNTKPMLPASLGRLDEFAQRQLDKLESKYSAINNQSVPPASEAPLSMTDLQMQNPSHDSDVTRRWDDYVSAEGVRSLKYCLECLQLATQHIDQQIHVLRGAMSRSFASGEPHSSSTSTYGSTPESGHHAGSLAALLALAQRIKRDVVETVRRVVEIMGKYAGKALPVEARSAVRGFILSLPSRLAAINQGLPFSRSTNSTPQDAANFGEHEAQRVLSLAEESNNMLRNTAAVFGQTVHAAEYFFGSAATPRDGEDGATNAPQETDMDTS